MDVKVDPDGRPTPPFDDSWAPVEQLRWHAGVVALAADLRISVTDHGAPADRPGTPLFSLAVRSTRSLAGGGPMPFAEAWAYLDGVQAGAFAAATQ